jgi:20S proteasome subunit alpha 5
MVASSVEKLVQIDQHLGCAMSGLTADARTMIDHARVEAQNHWFTYDEKIKVFHSLRVNLLLIAG